MFSQVFFWIQSHFIEVLATIAALLYIHFSIKRKIILWLFGFISSALSVYVFFSSKLYADMSLNLYYVVISVYGYYRWMKGKEHNGRALSITKSKKSLLIILSILTTILFFGIAYILKNFTDSDIPYWDAFTTAASITATWMLAEKKLEHWYIWIVVDIVSAGLYLYKGLYIFVFLFLFYTYLAIRGVFEWNKAWKNEIMKE